MNLQTRQNQLFKRLQPLLNEAVNELGKDTRHYVSWHETSRLHEGNLTFHVGRQLEEDGFHYYTEVPVARPETETGKGNFFDALALTPDLKSGIIIESKYFFSGTVTHLNKDLKRMLREKPLDRLQCLKDYQIDTGMILVHTWRQEILEWWDGGYQGAELPKRKRVKSAWAPIRHVLLNGLSDSGVITDCGNCWMMWAIFPLECLKEIWPEP